MNIPPDVQNHPGPDLAVPPCAESANFPEQMPTTMTDDIWHQSWDGKPETTAFNPTSLTSTMDSTQTGPYSMHRKILKLNLDLIDDLELLEAGSLITGSPCLLREDLHPTIGKLDLPVFRMLSHSTQFLGILESEIGADPFENSVSLASTSDPSQKASSVQDDTKSPSTDFICGNMDDGETTTSTHDSGYFSLVDAASKRTKCLPFPKCEISTALSILATYCHLVRVYRAIFTQLYQLFLIIPPAEAAAFLLLPSLQFGQFHMDGNLTVKVQVLIELSSSMLEKIERTLRLSQSLTHEVDGKASPALYILEDSPLASIRDHIMAQEQVSGSIPLKETMNCLRQLLKDHVSV